MIKFYHGFIAGLAGHFSGELTGSLGGTEFQDVMSRTMVAASFGGISSSATGGDFVKGAMVAATVHLFNHKWKYRNIPKVVPGSRYDKVRQVISRINAFRKENPGKPIPMDQEQFLVMISYDASEVNASSTLVTKGRVLQGDSSFYQFRNNSFQLDFSFYGIPSGIYPAADINYYYQGLVHAHS